MRGRILLLILVVAFLMRFLGLSLHPAGFTPDEASFGYDAYSLMKTGKDQWGRVLPLSLKSFGDGKMPLYAYLTIPSIVIFGLNEFAVRLPNVIIGTLAVLATYFLVYEWRGKKNEALLAALLLAVSPWHVPMSRGAFEANMTTFFLPLGILLFLKGQEDKKYYPWSMVVMGLNLFTYHSARLVTPVVVAALVWQYKDEVRVKELWIFAAFLGLAFYTYFLGAGTRVATSSILSMANQAGNDRYQAVLVGVPDVVARVFNNKMTKTGSLLIRNYMQYFSPEFWFTQGPGEGTYGMMPGRGVLYLIEVVLLMGFIRCLAVGKIGRWRWFMIWILVAPIPAALSLGPGFAANRAAIMMPAVQIALAIGATWFYESRKLSRVWVGCYVILWLGSIAFFVEDYFVQQRAQRSADMVYGAVEMANYLEGMEEEYDQIVVSRSISEPHIFVAFAGEVDPAYYQQEILNWGFDESGLAWIDQLPEYSLGGYVFGSIDWHAEDKNMKTLIVGKPEEFPDGVAIMKVFYYPNGEEAFWVSER